MGVGPALILRSEGVALGGCYATPVCEEGTGMRAFLFERGAGGVFFACLLVQQSTNGLKDFLRGFTAMLKSAGVIGL